MNNKERLIKILIAQFLMAIIGIMIIGHLRTLRAQNWNDPDFWNAITYPVPDLAAPIVSPDSPDPLIPWSPWLMNPHGFSQYEVILILGSL
jgi:hypothetical protein